MKALTALALTSTIFISACTLQHEQYPPSTSSTPIMANEYSYHCESGKSVTVSYIQQDSATIHYQNEVYNMKIAISASGARYVSGKLVWWNKGAEGTLYQHNLDGSTGEALEVCTTKSLSPST